jgi:hypothetical protein
MTTQAGVHLTYIFKRNDGAGSLKIMKKCRRRHVHSSWLCRRRELISYYCRKHPCWILRLFNDKADIILLWVPIESTESFIAAPVVPIESTESLIAAPVVPIESLIAAPVVPPTIVIRITAIRITATGTAIRITVAIV